MCKNTIFSFNIKIDNFCYVFFYYRSVSAALKKLKLKKNYSELPTLNSLSLIQKIVRGN